ncbi:MAG: peptidoglycan D,D-transpeptidase FtsI family protein [Pyrinomonadaceae bacterium]
MRTRKRPTKKDLRQVTFFRYMLIIAVIVIWIGGISARLVYLQVNQHEWLKEKATGQRIDVKQSKMLRGTIFDRNERALAVSVVVKTLFADATEIEDIEKTASELASLLKINKSKIFEQLKDGKDLERRYVPIAKGLDTETALRLNAALETEGLQKSDLPKYPGLYWREEQKRSYPHQSLAAHVIGFSNNEGIGQAGIEQSQNDELYGAIIKKTQERDRLGRIYDETVSEKEPPKDIVLTINSSIQFKAEAALERQVKASQARAGMAIVLDQKTGEILALANYPTFDPNKLEGITKENLSNRCVQGVYSPGSVFKLVTYSSAFERDLLTPDSPIDAGNGTIEIAGHKFSDSHSIGRVDATKAFAHSSNVCAIKTSMRVGREGFYEMLQKYGFGKQTGVELPAETSGIVRNPNKWNGDSLASMSIGYEIGVSALQMATAFATIANNGVRVRPHIIKEIRQSDQTKIFEAKPEAAQVVSSKTAREMHQLMRAVVTSGTGTRAQLNGYTSAGKTGTAWKFDEKTKRISSAKYMSTFMGFAPLDNPAFTIAVVMDEPKVGGRDGGQAAAPVFKEIAESVLAEMQVPFDLTADNQPFDGEDVPEAVGNGSAKDSEPLEKRGSDGSATSSARSDPEKSHTKEKASEVPTKPKGPNRPKIELEQRFVEPKDKFKT